MASLFERIRQAAQQQQAPSGDAYSQITSQGRPGATIASGPDAGWQQVDMGGNQLMLVNPATREVKRAQVYSGDMMSGDREMYDMWGYAPSKDNFLDKYSLALVAGGLGGGALAAGSGAGGAAGAAGGWSAADLAAMDALAAGGTAAEAGAVGAGAVGADAVTGGAGVDALSGGAGDWWSEYGLSASDVGAGEAAATGGGDWWSQYGLTAADVGQTGAATGSATGGGLAGLEKSLGLPAGSLAAAGRALPGLLGALGSKKQAGALQSVADRYETYGGPSRGRYEASMAPGFDPMSIPGYSGAVDSASKSVLARLSANGGNPFGNPGGLIDAQKQIVAGTALPAIQEYQRLNAGTGFGTTLTAAGGFDRDAIGAGTNVFNAVGAGINDVTNPPKSLAEQMIEYEKMRKSLASTGAPSLA